MCGTSSSKVDEILRAIYTLPIPDQSKRADMFRRSTTNLAAGRSLFSTSSILMMRNLNREDIKKIVQAKLDAAVGRGSVVGSEGEQTFTFNDDVLLVDVRTPAECLELGMIPTSINIPVQELQQSFWTGDDAYFQKQFGLKEAPDPDKTSLIFLCRIGNRSRVAMQIAHEFGFELNLGHYAKGFTDWAAHKERIVKLEDPIQEVGRRSQ